MLGSKQGRQAKRWQLRTKKIREETAATEGEQTADSEARADARGGHLDAEEGQLDAGDGTASAIHELLQDISETNGSIDRVERSIEEGLRAKVKHKAEKIESRSLASIEKHRKAQEKLARQIGTGGALHESNNTIGWLQDVERTEDKSVHDWDINAKRAVWVLAFKMPELSMEQRLRDIPAEEYPISHEAWIIAERLLQCDLRVTHEVSFDGNTLYLLVYAPEDVLVNEAHFNKVQVRIQETKGQLRFHEDLVRYMATNHGGLNEYHTGMWVRRDPTQAQAWALDAIKSARDGEEVDDLGKAKSRKEDSDEETITTKRAENRKVSQARRSIFTSALAQRLVMMRMKRLGLVNLEQYKLARKPEVVREQVKRLANARKKIHASRLSELLLTHGALRPDAKSIFPMRGQGKHERPVVQKLVDCVKRDPDFVMNHNKIISHSIHPDHRPSYELISAVCNIFDEWRDPRSGKGRHEQFMGTLTAYLPVHDPDELKYLMEQWGTFNLLLKSTIVGYNPESEPSVVDRGPPQQLEPNTFGSDLNVPHEHALPWSWGYQPIEEIRDYFGDEIALYSAWLGAYIQALGMSSVFGIGTMILQPIFGGVDNNPGTLAYSVYVGLWSITFLSAWARRENELRFLWGTKELSSQEEVRLQFVGEIVYNADTGRTHKEPTSQAVQLAKRLFSIVVVLVMIMFTIFSATAAMSIRYLGDKTESGSMSSAGEDGPMTLEDIFEAQKFKVLSSVVNLTIIVSYGLGFEIVAELLNKFENHRTESQYANALVAKNFCFEFVNNYFILFYIAYMREMPDFFSESGEPHPCPGNSCLGELQMQLLIVFTAKTVGKQSFNLIKPFLFITFQTIRTNRHISGMVKNVYAGAMHISAVSQVAELASGAGLLQDDSDADTKMSSPVETQTKQMPYKGSFDDFKDRAIQFGYLVLFAPAYPLAPALALVNNIIEVRSAAYRMCHGFQRPPCRDRDGIGSWAVVLNLLGFLAVLTNASMIAFVGSQEAERFQLFSEHKCRLGVLSRQDCPSHASSSCTCMANRLSYRIDYYELWVVFMAIEHGLMLLRVVSRAFPSCTRSILTAIYPCHACSCQETLRMETLGQAILIAAPEMPAWVRIAKETLDYRKQNIFKTKDQLEVEARALEAFQSKLHDKSKSIRQQLNEYDEEGLKLHFIELDKDGSGYIDKRELSAFFAELSLGLTGGEIEMMLHDMAGDMSIDVDLLEIDCETLFTWLERNHLWDPQFQEKRAYAASKAAADRTANPAFEPGSPLSPRSDSGSRSPRRRAKRASIMSANPAFEPGSPLSPRSDSGSHSPRRRAKLASIMSKSKKNPSRSPSRDPVQVEAEEVVGIDGRE